LQDFSLEKPEIGRKPKRKKTLPYETSPTSTSNSVDPSATPVLSQFQQADLATAEYIRMKSLPASPLVNETETTEEARSESRALYTPVSDCSGSSGDAEVTIIL
jgi:hypothetical protein